MSKALVIGAKGRLGKAICKHPEYFPWHTLIPIKKKIHDFSSLEKYELQEGDILINCAAYTDVGKSDSSKEEFDKCQQINTILPHLLSAAAKDLGFKLVLFSTDYTIRKEFEKNNYAISKKNMEELCFQNSLIIRVSNLIGPDDKPNSNIVSKLLNQKGRLLLADAYVYPTMINDHTVSKLCQIIQSKGRGFINFFGEENWLPNFTRKLYKLKGKEPDIEINFRRQIGMIEDRYIHNLLDWRQLKTWVNS